MQDNESMITHSQAIKIRIGDYLMIHDHACKVVDSMTSKTGKHGGCKIHFVGIDIFTNKKYETIYKSDETIDVPVVTKIEYKLLNINRETPPYLTLVDNNNVVREDFRLPDGDLGVKIYDDFRNEKELMITTLRAVGKESIIAYKINN